MNIPMCKILHFAVQYFKSAHPHIICVSDIFFGAILGIIIAWFINYKQNIFKEKKVYKEEIEMNTSVEKRVLK